MRSLIRVESGRGLSMPRERMRITSGHVGVNRQISSTICSCSQLRCSWTTDVSSGGRGLGVHSDSGFSRLMLHLRILKPVSRQTLTQGHARAVKHDPQIAVRNRKRGAYLFALDFIHFAHHENCGHALRELAQTLAHYLPEFVAMHDFIGLRFPFFWAVHVHPVTLRHELFRTFTGKNFKARDRSLAAELAIGIAAFGL